MKLNVKTLKGTSFSVDVKSDDKVSDVKKNIEDAQGADVYPASQQMLIYQGKVLNDDTTLGDNKVAENSFLVVMLGKKTPSIAAHTSSPQPNQEAPAPAPAPVPAPVPASAPAPVPAPETEPRAIPPVVAADVYDQAASNVVVGRNMEATIQQIMDMGGGSWDKATVTRALHAAYNNPERAVEYLYSGIPDMPESEEVPTRDSEPTQPTSGPNSSPLDLFPQGLPSIGSTGEGGNLDFLRNSQQFQALRAMVQANPQILQPMLQELGKQNPQLMGLIEDHQTDFLRLINEPVEGEGNLLNQLASGMAETINVTPEEQEAIERLEAMGFDRALVLEVFFACNKNEELAANYLLDHMNEFED